jgi:hypothetical protein
MAELAGSIIDFYKTTGGVDTVSSSVNLGPTKLRDAQNVNYFPLGGVEWRSGYTALNSSAVGAATCNGVYMARFSSGTNIALLVANSKLYKMTGLNGTWTDITNGITISSSSSFPVTFAMLNDTVVMSNGNDTSWQTDSSGTTQVIQGTPAFTSALFNIEYHGYMFWGQTVETATRQYDRLRFSDLNNPNSFTMLSSNNFIDVAKKAGGDLRGAVVFGPYLYLFKRHGIYQITFQPTSVNSSGTLFPFTENPQPIVPNVGTQSHRSICKFTTPITNARESGRELVFFVDQFGIPRIFDGQTTVQIGYPISKSRDSNIRSLTNMDRTQLPYVWALNYPDRNQVWCFMSSASSQMDTCWVLDYSVDFVWARHSFATNFASGALFEKTDGTWKPYLGDYAGKVYEHDSGTSDNGTAITSYALWGDAFAGQASILSNWPWIEIKGATGDSSQTVTISVYPDGSDSPNSTFTTSTTLASSSTLWGSGMTWGTSTWARRGVSTMQKELGLDAKTLRVKLSNSTLNNTASIEGFSLNVIPKGVSQV